MDNLERIKSILDKWKDYVAEVNKNKDKIPEKEVREKLKAAINRIFDLFEQYEEESLPYQEDTRKIIKNVGVNKTNARPKK